MTVPGLYNITMTRVTIALFRRILIKPVEVQVGGRSVVGSYIIYHYFTITVIFLVIIAISFLGKQ